MLGLSDGPADKAKFPKNSGKKIGATSDGAKSTELDGGGNGSVSDFETKDFSQARIDGSDSSDQGGRLSDHVETKDGARSRGIAQGDDKFSPTPGTSEGTEPPSARAGRNPEDSGKLADFKSNGGESDLKPKSEKSSGKENPHSKQAGSPLSENSSDSNGNPSDPTGSTTGGSESARAGQATNVRGEEMAGAGNSVRSESKDSQERKNSSADYKIVFKNLLTKLTHLWPLIIIIGVIGFGIFFLGKKVKVARRKKAKAFSVPEEIRQTFAKYFRTIYARKMSPEEEVLKIYYGLEMLFKKIEYPRQEFIPPVHYSDEMAMHLPQIGVPFREITLAFCKVLYGKSKPGSETIKKLRSNLKSILNELGCGK
jgi:hypothetical protein